MTYVYVKNKDDALDIVQEVDCQSLITHFSDIDRKLLFYFFIKKEKDRYIYGHFEVGREDFMTIAAAMKVSST